METETKVTHTPGPWEVGVNEESPYGLIHSPSREAAIAEMEGNGQPLTEIMANAFLIASAPDMLAVLEWLVRLNMNPDSRSSEWYMAWNRAQTIIQKANGK